MKLKIILASALLCLFSACSFKSDNGGGDGGGGMIATTNELKIDPNADSDGDSVLDGEELNKGRNPFVAELPDLKVRFLQNYKIEVCCPSTNDTLPPIV